MGKLEALVEQMHPQDAMAAIAGIMQKLLQQTDEQGKLDFVMTIMGDAGADKIASMVNL